MVNLGGTIAENQTTEDEWNKNDQYLQHYTTMTTSGKKLTGNVSCEELEKMTAKDVRGLKRAR